MGSNENLDIPGIQQKARRSLRLAVIFAFLLAFFWSVGSFFIWIFLGATTYSIFLAWYYNSQTNIQAPSEFQTDSAPSASPLSEMVIKRMKIFLPVILGVVVLAIVVKMGGSSSDSAETQADTESGDKSEQSPTGGNQNLDSLINKGNDFYDHEEYDSALMYYNQALKVDPGNQSATYDKALVYYGKKDYRRAVPILIACIREHPDYGDALWLLGDVYFNQKNLDSAKVCFDRAYQTGLRNGAFLQLMAGLYETQDKSRSIELYKQSVQQDSTLIDSYKKLADAEPSEAEAYLRLVKKWSNKSSK